jgi:cytoskeletal protein CcmA (bactofilin family)
MTNNEFRMAEPNIAYIGAGVTVKGEISAPDVIVVDGTVEGDVTARSIRIGLSGAVKGNVVSNDAEVHGTLSETVDVKQCLLVRSTGRVEGNVNCGDLQIEKGAVLAASVHSSVQEKPVKLDIAPVGVERLKLAAAE